MNRIKAQSTRSVNLIARSAATAVVLSAVSLMFGVAGAQATAATATATATPSPSASPSAHLTLAPVGVAGTYFALTLAPGSSTTYQVSLSNAGTAASAYRTYAADIYTVADGGLGANIAGQPQTKTARWLDYPSASGSLAAGQALVQSFSVTVPPGTKAGQYTSGLVIEDAAPRPVATAAGLSQIIRSVIAVSIRVPGKLTAAFSLGKAVVSAAAADGHTAFTIPLTNTGNVLVKPAGTVRVTNLNGKKVYSAPIAMGSVYADTATTVDFAVNRALPRGLYTVQLVLTDEASGVTAAQPTQTISIGGAVAAAASSWQKPIVFALATLAALILIAALVFIIQLRRAQPRALWVLLLTGRLLPKGHRS